MEPRDHEDEVMGDRESVLEHECARLREENARLKATLAQRIEVVIDPTMAPGMWRLVA